MLGATKYISFTKNENTKKTFLDVKKDKRQVVFMNYVSAQKVSLQFQQLLLLFELFTRI